MEAHPIVYPMGMLIGHTDVFPFLGRQDMPRVGFIGVSVTKDDLKVAQELRDGSSGFVRKVLGELNHLESFMNANPQLDNESTDVVWAQFGGQWLNSGRAASTLKVIVDDMKMFRVNPWKIDEARARVREFQIRNGIMRRAVAEGKKNVRRVTITALPCVEQTRPSDAIDAERQAFWALVCVTGNRAANVLDAIAIQQEEAGVCVKWGQRKVRSHTQALYLYEWSERPPAWVLQRWAELGERPWLFRKSATIASACNAWLRKWGQPTLTSTSPRERLDNHLRNQVRGHGLRKEDYVNLIDHTFETGLAHYVGGISHETSGDASKKHRVE